MKQFGIAAPVDFPFELVAVFPNVEGSLHMQHHGLTAHTVDPAEMVYRIGQYPAFGAVSVLGAVEVFTLFTMPAAQSNLFQARNTASSPTVIGPDFVNMQR